MMHRSDQPGFPTARSVAALTVAAGMLLAGVAALAPWLTLHMPSILLGAGVVWLTSVLTMLLMSMLAPFGVMPAVYGIFISMGLRMAICLGVAMAAVHGGFLPGRSVAAGLAIFYPFLLAIEVTFLARFMWRLDAAQRPAPASEVRS